MAATFYLAPDGSPEWAGLDTSRLDTASDCFLRARALPSISSLSFPNDDKDKLHIQRAAQAPGTFTEARPTTSVKGPASLVSMPPA